MNKLKEILLFFILCFIACLAVKMGFNHFLFKKDLLIDSLCLSLGATTGYFLFDFFKNRKNKK